MKSREQWDEIIQLAEKSNDVTNRIKNMLISESEVNISREGNSLLSSLFQKKKFFFAPQRELNQSWFCNMKIQQETDNIRGVIC